MQLTILALLATGLSTVCLAGGCTDNISRTTPGVPEPTTSKITTTTTKKPEPPKTSTKPEPTTTKKPEPPKSSKKPETTPTPTKASHILIRHDLVLDSF
ncbi:unnamed protein product [Alternaria alternata]